MRWRHKALIQKTFSRLPGGDYLYRLVQKRFGTLDSDPWFRPAPSSGHAAGHCERPVSTRPARPFSRWAVGTNPSCPWASFWPGRAKIITVDLNRRMDPGYRAEHAGTHERTMPARIRTELGAEVPAKLIEPRVRALRDFLGSLQQLLELAKIEYLAPGRRGPHRPEKPKHRLPFFPPTTLEHISLPVLHDIFREAHRLLKPDGVAVHFIDLSDHYQHQGPNHQQDQFPQIFRR